MTYCDICTKRLERKDSYFVYGYTPFCRMREYECKVQLCKDCYVNMFKDVDWGDDDDE